MVFSVTPLLIAGLAAHATFANPVPPPDCALDTPPSCTGLNDPYHHGGIPLPPRAATLCPLNNPGCGPIVVSRAVAPVPTPTPTSTTLAKTATCIPYTGTVPIFDGCPPTGPDDECISIVCFDYPQTCGCPGAPPQAASDAPEKRDISSTTTTTTSATAATCTPYPGALPIFEECSRSGPNPSQCIISKCMEHPNTCGCPGSPPEKRDAGPATTTSATAATCTPYPGVFPISEECSRSGGHYSQCIASKCMEYPNTCGCPGSPPESGAGGVGKMI